MVYNGADVEQLRSTATHFERLANNLDATSKSLHSLINAANHWLGPDADRFRAAWSDGSARTMTTAAAALRQGAVDLRRNADDQVSVSSTRDAAPGSTAQLLAHIKNNVRDDDGVRIEKVVGSDGQTRLIVYLKGQDSTDNRTFARNFPLLAGGVDSEVTAKIDAAIKDSPDGKNTDIMLVGLSQGGMDAQNIAASGRYHVTTLVTYGSPLIQSDIPGVAVLHLQASGDAVPIAGEILRTQAHLPSASTDYLFEAGSGVPEWTLLQDHSTGYPTVAQSFDNSTDPHWAAVKASMEKYQGVIVTATE
jgi:dienelactone hydrolase